MSNKGGANNKGNNKKNKNNKNNNQKNGRKNNNNGNGNNKNGKRHNNRNNNNNNKDEPIDYSFLPGTASLMEQLDKKILVVLRDGRKLVGILRSFDQFANIVLEDTIERIYVGEYFGDLSCGVFLIRGENVVLLGEVDDEKEENANANLKQVDEGEIMRMQREDIEEKESKEKMLKKLMKEKGIVLTKNNEEY